jgi:hypothetical protein
VTVNSLLFACERSQIFLLTTGSQKASSDKVNLTVNALMIFPSFAIAIYYPQVGTVAGLCGAFATMFCIYILPIATYLKHRWTQINNPEKIKELVEADNMNLRQSIEDIKNYQNQKSSEMNKYIMLACLCFVIVMYGIMVFVLNVNSFIHTITS